MNTPAPQARRLARPSGPRPRAVGCVPIRSASFVSIMCDAAVVRERGLPVADYFLWNDDFEYSTRLIRGGVGLSCPDSVVVHKTKVFGSTDADPGERFFFEVRNKVWLFTRSTGLTPPEKAVYGGSTVRRWARTFARSADRAHAGAAACAAGWPPACGSRPAAQRRGARRGRLVARTTASRPTCCRPGSRSPCSSRCTAATTRASCATAFTSSVQEQTRRPDQVVLVQDGPVPDELAAHDRRAGRGQPGAGRPRGDRGQPRARARRWTAGSRPATTRSWPGWTPTTSACPTASRSSCRSSRPARTSSAAGCSSSAPPCDDVVGRRTPPTDPDEIRRVIRFRDPFNHPTVVYRRSAVQAAGGYTDMALMEDYLLFARMVDARRPAGQPRRAAGLLPGRRRRLRPPRRPRAAALRARPAAPVPASSGITTRGQYLRNVAVRGGLPSGAGGAAQARLPRA